MILSSSAPSDHVNVSHHMAFDVFRPLTFHILMFFRATTGPNWMLYSLDGSLPKLCLCPSSMPKMATTAARCLKNYKSNIKQSIIFM
jgi:hypothetical protein